MRRPPLTATLAAMFALVTLLTFYLVGGYLYANLRTQILRIDTEEVLIKARHLRSLVQEEYSRQSLLSHASRFAGQVVGSNAFIVRILADDGRPLVDFNPTGLPVITMAPIKDSGAVDYADVRQWRSPSDRTTVRGVALRVRFHNGDSAVIFVGRSIDDVLDVLSAYRAVLQRGIVMGALLTIILGYLLVRRALRPLHEIAEETGRINVEGAHVRLAMHNRLPELRELSVSLNGMLGRLERRYQLLSQYTENLAHDLRTPVNNLRGQTEVLLSRQRTAEEYQVLLLSNLEEYERLSRMIENTLFLARAENAQIVVRHADLDLNEQLRQIAAYFEGLADESGVALSVQARGSIRADAVLFRRAISNLVANGLRYTPRGTAIRLNTAEAPGGTLVCVSNPGPAIATEHLDRIFERFYRVEEARTNSAASTGLGLAIVRSIMELHQGRVSAENGDGFVRFCLFFPGAEQPGAM